MITLQKERQSVVLPTLPRVNLLPPDLAEAAHLRRIQLGLGVGVVAAVGLVGLLYAGASGAVSDADRELQAATAEHGRLQAQVATYRDVTGKYAAAGAAQEMLVQAMGGEVRYSRFLNDLSLSMPDGVWLTSATWSQDPAGTAGQLGTVSMSGVAKHHDDVAVWLEKLASQPGYASPYLQSATEALLGTQVVVNWSTTVALTPDALSGRYHTSGS